MERFDPDVSFLCRFARWTFSMKKSVKRQLNLPRVPIPRPVEDVIPDKSKRIPRKAKHKKRWAPALSGDQFYR